MVPSDIGPYRLYLLGGLQTGCQEGLLGMREETNRITGETQKVDYQTSSMTTSELASLMDKMKTWAQTDLGCYLPYFGDPGYEEMYQQYNWK